MQEHQIYQNFVVYLNQTIKMLNSMKSSLYDVLNISIKPIQNYIIEPSMPSITAHCKKTMDDLKRITSILRGYSKSKNQQRQDENYRMSRFNDSLSRQSEASIGKSQYSNKHSRFKKSETRTIDANHNKNKHIGQNGINMVTFQIDDQNHKQSLIQESPQLKEQQRQTPISKLKGYRSVQDFHNQSKKSHNRMKTQQCKTVKDTKIINKNQINQKLIRSKRAKTLNKQINYASDVQINLVSKPNNDEDISNTQSKLIKCLVKQQSGINEIIQRNSQCLTMLKQIHSNLKKKKLCKKGLKKQNRIKNSQIINSKAQQNI